jgi:hypothetical protein
MARHQEVIDAYVTEVLTHRPGDELTDPAGFGLPCQGAVVADGEAGRADAGKGNSMGGHGVSSAKSLAGTVA